MQVSPFIVVVSMCVLGVGGGGGGASFLLSSLL